MKLRKNFDGYRTLRGHGYRDGAWHLRMSLRLGYEPQWRDADGGFRFVIRSKP